jgi:hypothetical protein
MSDSKEKKKEIEEIHKGKAVTDPWGINLFNSLTYDFLNPIFDYVNENKDNLLNIDMLGNLTAY